MSQEEPSAAKVESAPSNTKNSTTQLLVDSHAKFVLSLDEHEDRFEFWTNQHLRMNGLYWGVMAMHLMKRLSELKISDIIDFIGKCQNSDGGFGGNVGHDSHLLYTLSAVQIMAILNALDKINIAAVVTWVSKLQKEDGSFSGDEWEEIDTRFTYCAFNCLSLLGRLDAVNVEKGVEFVLKCENWDGGFGVVPQAESHAGQIFCCVGALRIANALDRIDIDRLGWWLAERQLPSGGLNGRPEKKADVCYSWWTLSSLAMLERVQWIDRNALIQYILLCQDAEDGGIADKPGNMPDVFHTFFGCAGLSLLHFEGCELNTVNPAYAMPPETLIRLGVPKTRGGEV